MGLAQDRDIRGRARLRGIVRPLRRHQRDVVVQVQRLDHEVLALVDVDRPVVHLAHRARRIHGAEQAPVGDVHDHHLLTNPATQRHRGVRRLRRDLPVQLRHREPASRPAAQKARGGQVIHHVARAERLHVGLTQRPLHRRAVHVPAQNERVGGVEHGVFHRRAQQRVGVVDQVGVHRLVAGHQHRHRALPAPARAPGLLPKRRHRARKPRHHHRVQPADVDAQLQRVRGRHPQQLTGVQAALQLAAVLRQIPRPVGCDALGHIRPARRRQVLLGAHRHRFRGAPGPHERQRPRALQQQLRGHRSGLRGGGVAYRRATFAFRPFDEAGLPQHDGALASRGGVVGYGHRFAAAQPASLARRVRRGGGGVNHRRRRTVGGRDAQQSP